MGAQARVKDEQAEQWLLLRSLHIWTTLESATHAGESLLSQVTLPGNPPQRHTQRGSPKVIPDPIKLAIKIYHHRHSLRGPTMISNTSCFGSVAKEHIKAGVCNTAEPPYSLEAKERKRGMGVP